MNYVAGFMFNGYNNNCHGTEVALVLKAKPKWQKGKLNAVGGSIKPSLNERPVDAMVRKFHEETKVRTYASDWRPFITLTKTDECVVHFFKAFVNHRPTLFGEPQEPVNWYGLYNLPSNIIPNLRWLIPYALHADNISHVVLKQVN